MAVQAVQADAVHQCYLTTWMTSMSLLLAKVKEEQATHMGLMSPYRAVELEL